MLGQKVLYLSVNVKSSATTRAKLSTITKDASNSTRTAHFAEGDTLEDEFFENLVAGISDRVEAVIRAQGGYTKY